MGDSDKRVYKDGKGHSTLCTVIIILIFMAAAFCWLKSIVLGILLTILGGVVFGITYKGNKRQEIDEESDSDQ